MKNIWLEILNPLRLGNPRHELGSQLCQRSLKPWMKGDLNLSRARVSFFWDNATLRHRTGQIPL